MILLVFLGEPNRPGENIGLSIRLFRIWSYIAIAAIGLRTQHCFIHGLLGCVLLNFIWLHKSYRSWSRWVSISCLSCWLGGSRWGDRRWCWLLHRVVLSWLFGLVDFLDFFVLFFFIFRGLIVALLFFRSIVLFFCLFLFIVLFPILQWSLFFLLRLSLRLLILFITSLVFFLLLLLFLLFLLYLFSSTNTTRPITLKWKNYRLKCRGIKQKPLSFVFFVKKKVV